MLQYRREPESRPAPVKEFEAAMDALCRALGQRQMPVRRSRHHDNGKVRSRRPREHEYGPQLDATTFLRRSHGIGALSQMPVD
jgi:hypothetical protein